MSLTVLGAYPLGGINLAAAASLNIVAPVFTQFDAALFGAFGLGGVQSDIATQFNTALSLSVKLTGGSKGAAPSFDPAARISALANLLASLQASAQASAQFGAPRLPTLPTAAIAANASLQAALAVRLGGITAVLKESLSVKITATKFFADLSASLNAGPVFLLRFDSLATAGGLTAAGAQIAAQFAAGLSSGPSSIGPGESVQGLVLVTKEPTAFAAMSTILKVT